MLENKITQTKLVIIPSRLEIFRSQSTKNSKNDMVIVYYRL